MSTTPIGAPSALDPLVKQLVDRVDRNKDGQISTDEFGAFLTDLLRANRPPVQEAGPIEVPPETATPGAPQEISPSQWTANNAPYGVTFAGFSPQDHTDLTLEDLGVPGKAEKYAVYNYLLSNQVQPTKDWAPAVAEALNQKYKTTVFKAIDGETLGYGNEYVHSAPNGYGMVSGTYNANATGEFFWGWT